MTGQPGPVRPLVAFDAAPARPAPAGVGVYVRELARALLARGPERIALIGVRTGGGLDLGPSIATRLGAARHHAWLQTRADRDARATGAALAHWTNAAAPLLGRLPYVVTIQDLSVLRHPGWHPPARALLIPLVVTAAWRARAVLVPSAATALELRRIGVPARRIARVELAPAPRPASSDAGEVLERHGLLAGRYLLCLGTIEPRKNHVRLIAAFERLAAELPDLQLVLAGGLGWRIGPILRAIEESPATARIRHLGYLADDEIGALMGGCAAVVYPSLYEGYGLTVVEAMAAGAAVVTSDRSSLPEAAGGAAVLVDPESVASIAAGIREALGRVEELRAAGRRRAVRSWDDVAADTAEVYTWAANRSP